MRYVCNGVQREYMTLIRWGLMAWNLQLKNHLYPHLILIICFLRVILLWIAC